MTSEAGRTAAIIFETFLQASAVVLTRIEDAWIEWSITQFTSKFRTTYAFELTSWRESNGIIDETRVSTTFNTR
jgi:hypothetical protein